MIKPQTIFLDAVGTLFGVKQSVGAVYSAIAREFGVEVDPQTLDAAFRDSFRAADPLAFPEHSIVEVPRCEYEWWQVIAAATFTRVQARDQFDDFEAFFNRLYGYFATPAPWAVYPDILPALTAWRKDHIELGIISNFDTRIHAVLSGLHLHDFFSSITISSLTGAAKPDTAIFMAALAKHNCSPERAWHIGDSVKEDYEGAKAAGLHPILLKRAKGTVS
ncbi:MAG: HAD-IA family hydrolase [Spirulinaceae cyanobacterium RM2_2_10]|nr:HAD-IA family hydrolase [Spirulinaceae cyanobacterium SM2_1_0]NJO18834.1 HAD-IA family hydrolase [Spirulinaceae cyanobacterium RM2_2_10]